MVATGVFKWIIQNGNQQLEGTLLTYDALTFHTQIISSSSVPNVAVVERRPMN
jgi:hypothetical protein